ncbi:MAG TPA: hypothetical protein VNC50_08650, partial [Planctomycetia bacterium]|nr:hypothetical protein [Planctomycetia bacterium]
MRIVTSDPTRWRRSPTALLCVAVIWWTGCGQSMPTQVQAKDKAASKLEKMHASLAEEVAAGKT